MSIEFNKKKILKYEYLYDFVINGVVINNSRFFLDSKLFIYYIFKGKFHKKYCTIKYYSPIIDKDFQHMKNHLITIFLVYINFFKKENFESNQKCEFIPWGPSKRACMDRCRVDRELWGGDACTPSACYSICLSCVDKDKCDWLNSRDFLEEEREIKTAL